MRAVAARATHERRVPGGGRRGYFHRRSDTPAGAHHAPTNAAVRISDRCTADPSSPNRAQRRAPQAVQLADSRYDADPRPPELVAAVVARDRTGTNR